MAIPKLLKDVSLFIDGKGYAGNVEEFDLPKLTVKTEEHRAGGMDVPLEIDMGMEKLEATVSLSNADRDALKLFGLAPGSLVPLTLRGSQEDEGGDAEPVVHTLRGQLKEVDWGTWKSGEKAPCKLMVALRYYKLEVGGEIIHGIDAENMKRVINGVDQLEKRRQALGL